MLPLKIKLAMPVPPHPNLPPQAGEGANVSLREFRVKPANNAGKVIGYQGERSWRGGVNSRSRSCWA